MNQSKPHLPKPLPTLRARADRQRRLGQAFARLEAITDPAQRHNVELALCQALESILAQEGVRK